MISVRFWTGVLLKSDKEANESAASGVEVGSKKIEKIFGKAFDKAEKCAIVYITRLIRSLDLKRSGSDH